MPPVPIDPQIPISSSNSDECLNDFSLSHFSSCFNDKIKVGIPINKQCRAIAIHQRYKDSLVGWLKETPYQDDNTQGTSKHRHLRQPMHRAITISY